MNMPTKTQIQTALDEVMDPELNISVIDLGLIYNVTIKKEKVHILMTLTTMGCPLFGTIEEEIKFKLGKLGLKNEMIEIELTFDPPWSMDKMSEKGKAILGI